MSIREWLQLSVTGALILASSPLAIMGNDADPGQVRSKTEQHYSELDAEGRKVARHAQFRRLNRRVELHEKNLHQARAEKQIPPDRSVKSSRLLVQIERAKARLELRRLQALERRERSLVPDMAQLNSFEERAAARLASRSAALLALIERAAAMLEHRGRRHIARQQLTLDRVDAQVRAAEARDAALRASRQRFYESLR